MSPGAWPGAVGSGEPERIGARRDAWSGAALLALAAAYGAGAARVPPAEGEPGPRFLPVVLAICLATSSGWILVSGIARARRAAASGPGDGGGGAAAPTNRRSDDGDSHRAGRAWLAALATLAYAALLPPLGFVASTLGYAATLTALFSGRRIHLVVVPPAVTLALFAFFRLALGVRLPPGPFG